MPNRRGLDPHPESILSDPGGPGSSSSVSASTACRPLKRVLTEVFIDGAWGTPYVARLMTTFVLRHRHAHAHGPTGRGGSALDGGTVD